MSHRAAMPALFRRISLAPLLALAFGVLAVGCTTFKFSHDWELYSKWVCEGSKDHWTRSKLHSAFPAMVYEGRVPAGISAKYGPIGLETYRLDSRYQLKVRFAYKDASRLLPDGKEVAVELGIEETLSPFDGELPRMLPDDRMIDGEVVCAKQPPVLAK